MPEFPVTASCGCVSDRLDGAGGALLSGKLLVTPLVATTSSTVVLHGVEEQDSNRCHRCRTFRSRCFPWSGAPPPSNNEGCVFCQDLNALRTSGVNGTNGANGSALASATAPLLSQHQPRMGSQGRLTPASEWLVFVNDWSHERIQVPTRRRTSSVSSSSGAPLIQHKTVMRRHSFEGHVVPRRTIVFAIDLSLHAHELHALGTQLLTTFDALGDDTLVGLVAFGKAVMLYELESRDDQAPVKVDVYSGKHSPRVDVEQRQIELHECSNLFLASVDSENGHALGSDQQDEAQQVQECDEAGKKLRYVAFKKTCAHRFRQVVTNLMTSRTKGDSSSSSSSSTAPKRVPCCLGVALEYATLLSKFAYTNAGVVIGFTGETCTVGAGQIVNWDFPKVDPIPLDAIHASRSFYQQLGAKAASLGVTLSCFCCGNSTTFGAQAIDEAMLRSNGLLCHVGTFHEEDSWSLQDQLLRLVNRKCVANKLCMTLRVSSGFCIEKVDGPVCVISQAFDRDQERTTKSTDARVGATADADAVLGPREIVVEAVACDANFNFQVSVRPVWRAGQDKSNKDSSSSIATSFFSFTRSSSFSQQMGAIAPIGGANKCYFQLETHFTNQQDQGVTQFVTLAMPVTSDLLTLYRSLDVDTTCCFLAKQIIQEARNKSLESARSALHDLLHQIVNSFTSLEKEEVGTSLPSSREVPYQDQSHKQNGPELATCFAQLQRCGITGFLPKRLVPLLRSLLLLRRSPLLGEKFAFALEMQPFLWHLVLQSSAEETMALASPVLCGFADLNNPSEDFQVFPLLHSALQSNRMLCLDQFTDVFLWEGSQTQNNAELYQASKQVLLEYATSLTSHRLFAPHVHLLQEGTFWSRCLETRLILDDEELFPVNVPSQMPGLFQRLGSWITGQKDLSILR